MLNISAQTAAKLYLALLRNHDGDPEKCFCADWRTDDEKNFICVDCQTREALSDADGLERTITYSVGDVEPDDETSSEIDPAPQASA